MSEFTVRGRHRNRKSWRTFEKRLEAENEAITTEHTSALFGSAHGLKRTQVEIEEVESA